jgi:hypothetical protein
VLLKVVNFKRSKNQVAGGVLLKVPTFHSYGAVFARSRAVESSKRSVDRGVFYRSLLKKAGITCVISTSEGNDDMIIPRRENLRHALIRVGNDRNSIVHVRI